MTYPRNDLTLLPRTCPADDVRDADPYEDYDGRSGWSSRRSNLLLIVHADHEQNCSTSTVRMVGSSLRQPLRQRRRRASRRPVGSACTAGRTKGVRRDVGARFATDGKRSCQEVRRALAKDKTSGVRLMGFGHRVYKNYDPRATNYQGDACDRSCSPSWAEADPML